MQPTLPAAFLLTALAAASASAQQATATRLPEVVISATLSEQDARLAPASTTVISREELERRHATDLLEAVRGTPGFTLSPRQVGGRATFSLRGLEGKHTLILVDGRRIAPSDDVVGHSDYQYGWLPMSAISRVEVIRGPMSALYGSEAIGGVINVITRPSTDKWTGALAAHASTEGGGDGQRQQAQFYAAGPLAQGLQLRLSGSYGHADPVALEEDRRYSEIEGRRQTNLGLGLAWQFTREQQLTLDAIASDETRERGNLNIVTTPTRKETEFQDIYDLTRRHLALGWEGRFGSTFAQVRAYRSELDVQNRRTAGIAPTRPQNLQDQVVDARVGFDWAGQRFTVGGEHRVETLRNAGLVGGKDDATHQALYAQGEFSLTPQWELTAGVHQNHHEFFGNETSPRVYLVGNYGDWVVKGGFGHAFKAPTLKQISPSYVGAEGPHTFLGNGDIRPESSNSAELGVSYASGGLEASLTAFNNAVKDLITYRQIKQEGVRRTYLYDNVDRARLRGVELGLKQAINAQWRAGLDANWLQARDQRSGKALDDRPKLSFSGRLDWQGAEALGGWSGFVRFEHIGSQTTGGLPLPSYTLWHAGAGWQLTPATTLRAGVDNLADLRLAERNANFGYAERGRSVYLRVATQW